MLPLRSRLSYGLIQIYNRNTAVTRNIHSSVIRTEQFNIQDEEDFKKRVVNSTVPVVVDFHATWCGPCKLLAPRIESIIGELGDTVHLAKVDIDENADIAMEYGVGAVPAVMGMKGGKVMDKFIGLQDVDKIKTFIQKLIKD